jgi:hypothetical protein
MEVFVVSFLVFASVAGLLVLGQLLAGRRLPVGCRPESGICCRTAGGRGTVPDSFGNPIGPEDPAHGRVDLWHPETGGRGD